jgi:hypothetical protein
MTDALKGVKVGDELVLTSNDFQRKYDKGSSVTVTKVGTKLVHIGQTAYRIESGIINDNLGHTRLWFPQDWKAEQRRGELEESLRRHGVEVWRGGPKSIRTLERLLEVMENPE